MLTHKLGEIGAVCVIGLGYCAREYELIGPNAFKHLIAVTMIFGAVLLWRLFFEPAKS